MSVEHVVRVLRWAEDPRGLPPREPLRSAPDWADRHPLWIEPLQRLAAVAAGRLQLGRAVFERSQPETPLEEPQSEPQEIPTSLVLLAAAVGCDDGSTALRLLEAAPRRPRNDADQLVRWALTAPLLEMEDRDPVWREALREAAPLAAVCERPAEQQDAPAVRLVRSKLESPRWRSVLAGRLGEIAPRADVRRWRGRLLGRLRGQGDSERQFVVACYLHTLTRHPGRAEAQLRAAERILQRRAERPRQLGVAPVLDRALALLEYWESLSDLQREAPEVLRELRVPETGLRTLAVELVRRARRLAGAVGR